MKIIKLLSINVNIFSSVFTTLLFFSDGLKYVFKCKQKCQNIRLSCCSTVCSVNNMVIIFFLVHTFSAHKYVLFNIR